MDSRELFERSIAQASEVVEEVRADDFTKPTPDTEWDARALLNHMMKELAWSADIIEGKTIEQVGSCYDGDLIGSDLKENWREYADKALETAEEADTDSVAHLSFGDFDLEYYLRQVSNDFFIHAWDLGEAIGFKVQFPPDIAEELYDYNKANAEAIASSGLFAEPVLVSDKADVQVKLLALTGRSVDWKDGVLA